MISYHTLPATTIPKEDYDHLNPLVPIASLPELGKYEYTFMYEPISNLYCLRLYISFGETRYSYFLSREEVLRIIRKYRKHIYYTDAGRVLGFAQDPIYLRIFRKSHYVGYSLLAITAVALVIGLSAVLPIPPAN